ncbi:ral GTPase-activating protein subunit alpha-1-like isoform X2 [Pecten maximus]|uniref:ral GTPase-activating protein subunit alpha-1-like isoform X2 n=1 Tax=Pecten maximus TaxID=6579 RepID=UPI0014582A22|nr:ral GTPase-activating protein subunit alpha-1-like isoform X2 [Pecten maximus]
MSSALAMFRKAPSHGDIRKSAQKVSDPKKDTPTRLKHLRQVLENYEVPDAKSFFEANYSHIYFIFNDNFATVEADLKQRANKAHREELDSILQIFEKILLLLPELVHKRWMFHSIGRIMKKLLHPSNGLKTRKDGMRLFIIWYQILQGNASEECHRIFLQLVPGLGDGVQQELLSSRNSTSEPTDWPDCGGLIAAGEITPILPASGEKLPDNITKHFFDCLLHDMVSEITKVVWLNKEMQEASFIFLFNKFKTTYLTWLLPDFDRSSSIYDPVLEMPEKRKMQDMKSKDLPVNVAECRYSYIKWLALFLVVSNKPEQQTDNDVGCTVGESGVAEDDQKDMTDHKVTTGEHMPGSNASTLSTVSHSSEQDSANSSLCYEDVDNDNSIVRNVLFSTRENVNIVHESFRQALLFSFQHAKAIKTVIGVYKDWFQHADQKPIFMQEPSENGTVPGQRDTPEFHHSLSDIMEEEGSSDESVPYTGIRQLITLDTTQDKSKIRNASYLGAIQELADGGDHSQYDIRAGIQKVLQVFITNAANIFLLQTDEENMLTEQVDLCKRVLNIYRFLVMNIKMEQKTWEKMLQVLLCVTSGVLHQIPIDQKWKFLGGRLAQIVFQTLIVTWIKANLNVFISTELWDEFLQVLSSLTSWPELIQEWAKTMEILTRVLARQVYNLDLYDLPLQRLSEQKAKRKRGRSQDITKTKNTDKSFSKSWSKNEPQGASVEKSSSVTLGGFERGKYKSDGAGGGRPRPDLNKQRSLSGEPSPSHSRTPSNASDTVLYTRSSSDGNLAEASELVERLKGFDIDSVANKKSLDGYPACNITISVSAYKISDSVGAATPEDQEVAEITLASSLPSAHDMEYNVESASLDRSDETAFRYSRTPSPLSLHSKSRSPSPCSELTVEGVNNHKDCPTPDRDSLHIEMVATEEIPIGKESMEDMKSVLAGGAVIGWTPDVAVVMWRRMLGSLGNINQIEDGENHAIVYEELNFLLETLYKMRDNLGVTIDNMNSPSPPELLPPIHLYSPWLFECLTLSNKYKRGKLLAYQLMCQMVVQRHPVSLPSELVSQFYLALHQGLTSNDQDIINVLVRYAGARFFSMPLLGSTLLIANFIHAASAVLSAVDITETPRTEAVSVLGALLCFPNHLHEVQVLQHTNLSVNSLHLNEFKEQVINTLLRAGKKEPAGLARCVAVSTIGIFLYEELSHGTLHPKLNEAVTVLLGALRCVNRMVSKLASDMLCMLCDHSDKLLSYDPALPKRIIEVIAATVSTLIPLSRGTNSEEEKKLIMSMMFCMAEWCLRMPIHLLLETTDTDKGCVYKVFEVLNTAVRGHTQETLLQARQLLAGMIQDSDFEYLRDMSGFLRKASTDSLSSQTGAHSGEQNQDKNSEPVELAARTLIGHLVNHLCHFPMGAGAARLNSNIQEHHDNDQCEIDDLKQEIFFASNIQFFVLNQKTLISFIELPAQLDVPGGGVTAGLTTARSVGRVLLRDLTGKYSWESSVLYAPPWCQQGSSTHNAKILLDLLNDGSLEPLIIQEDPETLPLPTSTAVERLVNEIPHYRSTSAGQDNLNDMLRYIGCASPECLLIPGVSLNLEAPAPEGFSEDAEANMTHMVIKQKEAELNFYNQHKRDTSMLAKSQMPTEIQEPVSPFQICRMLVDQLGLLAWEKRCHFDLLKKSDKLLREMKHLDNQKCRETHKFAVIYVAEGQEDKNSILSNSGGSKAFEEFVSGLGWEIELETHQGFIGGLQQNRTTGDTAPYYATSLCECIFHVSTRMPSGTDDARHIKMRHLGNDEVHIVWSEHSRDYRRGIIPTEFGDVLIIIYPLTNGLYRVQINKKPEIPYFGPVFDGAILDRKVLPGLVRATAINASRVKRSLIPFYHSFYEERAKSFNMVIQHHIDLTMFEDFSASVFSPVLPPNSTISDQSLDLPPSASSNSLELSQQAGPEQVSPPSGRQSRGSDSGTIFDNNMITRTARRLSLKGRKSSSSKSSSMTTPPESPNMPKNKKH